MAGERGEGEQQQKQQEHGQRGQTGGPKWPGGEREGEGTKVQKQESLFHPKIQVDTGGVRDDKG